MAIMPKNNITLRVDMNLGHTCNAQCRFCYYQKSINSNKTISSVAARAWLRYFFLHGKRGVEFTGGEPTIREDICDLVKYAHDIGYKDIALITNAIALTKEKITELKANGLTEFLFSVHGSCPKIHDHLTGVDGSFDLILSAIKTAVDLGILCRANIVVTGVNVCDLQEITSLLSGLGIKRVNFILFNPVVDAADSEKNIWVDYSTAAERLKKVIDIFSKDLSSITVRYIPFCFMQGYEKYVVNLRQVQYDQFEWDYYLRSIYLRGMFLTWAAILFGFLLIHMQRDRAKGVIFSRNDCVMETIIFLRKRYLSVCKRCLSRNCCDGVWKEYVTCYGGAGFSPIISRQQNAFTR